VPLYNHSAYIAEAIASVLLQGRIVLEVIVLDDGSEDDSAKVMQGLVSNDPRIRFERQENRGAHATINAAVALCSGDYIAILNSDDVWLPDRLRTLAAALDADATVGIAASGLHFMDSQSVTIENNWYDAALSFSRSEQRLGVALLNGNFLMTTSNLMFRRATFEDVGPFAALRYAHDLDWLLRALSLGKSIFVSPTPLMRYRIHGSNTIAEDHTAVRAEWAIVASAYLGLLWDAADGSAIDWEHAAAAQAVLRTHALDCAVPLCMAYLRHHGGARLDGSPLLGDQAFRSRVRGWV
jgi:glycosyltransferase involved in cell wall biosynthesis